MSDHKLAEALRRIANAKFGMTTADAFHLQSIAREAIAAHEQQQAGEAVAIVELKTCGGNAGLSTRIKEIEDPMRDRLIAGTKLFTHPQQPLSLDQIISATSQIDFTAAGWMVAVTRAIEAAHGITKD